jgi:hypothetical protein
MRRDRHLNLFHNYNNEHIQGKAKKTENVETQGRGIIEDNVTRAFIIFLDFLAKTGKLQDFFSNLLKHLPKEKIGSNAEAALKKIKSPQFDLQNLDDKADHRRVRETDVAKVLMIISTIPFDLQTLAESNKPVIDTQTKGQAELRDNENRADAWILQKKDKGETVEVAVLLEAKIGNNPISISQILRHLGREKFGFNIPLSKINEFCDTNVINLTWRDINNCLERLQTNDKETAYFTRNLKEYILMSNGDVDIKNLLKEDTDSIERKQIFAHILGKVNEKIKHHFESTAEGTTKIKMSGRPLAGLWDYWGILDAKGVPQRSPHISLGLTDEFMLIGFDTYNLSQKSIKET